MAGMLKRHYEKVIVACAFLFIFVNLGLASTAFSVHQPYIVAMDGIGDTGGSLILSARTLTSFICMFFVDRFYAALDVRRGVSLMCLSVACGFTVFAFADSLPAFMAGAVLMGVAYGMGGAVASTFVMNRWFSSGIGSAVGIAAMGSGLCSIAMPLVVVQVIESASLSAAFLLEAAIALVIAFVVFAFVRNRPADMGLEKHEAASVKTRSHAKHALLEAPTHERHLLLAAMVLVGIFCCCGMTYLSVLATSSGFDAVFAATLVSVAGLSLTVSKFVAGELFDHLGAPRASLLVFAIGFTGFTLCCFAGLGSRAVMIAGAAAVGTGLTLGTVGLSVWSIDLSTPEARTKQIKNFQIAYALGGFIANTLPGIVKDLVGTYVVSYAASAAVLVAAAVVILRFYRKFRP